MDALLFFSSCCLMIVAWLFLMVSDMGVSVVCDCVFFLIILSYYLICG